MKIIKLKLQSLHKITKAVFQFMYFFMHFLKILIRKVIIRKNRYNFPQFSH